MHSIEKTEFKDRDHQVLKITWQDSQKESGIPQIKATLLK